jgi:predicted DNA-binding transcriptional regulator AlpA
MINTVQTMEVIGVGRDTFRKILREDITFPRPYDPTGSGRKRQWSREQVLAWKERKAASGSNNEVTPQAVAGVTQQYPNLGLDGFGDSPRSFDDERYLKEINTAFQFIKLFGAKEYSYGLKHRAEKWGKHSGMSPFVGNGSAIVAAILHGYKPVRIQGPNCEFEK